MDRSNTLFRFIRESRLRGSNACGHERAGPAIRSLPIKLSTILSPVMPKAHDAIAMKFPTR